MLLVTNIALAEERLDAPKIFRKTLLYATRILERVVFLQFVQFVISCCACSYGNIGIDASYVDKMVLILLFCVVRPLLVTGDVLQEFCLSSLYEELLVLVCSWSTLVDRVQF